MDDVTHYTIQIKGTAYRFAPLPTDDIKRIMVMSQLDPTGLRSFKVLAQALAASAGPEQWGAILDRYVAREVTEAEITSAVFGRLIKRQNADEEKRSTDGLDVAGQLPSADGE